MSSSRWKYLVREVLPLTALIMVECTNVGTMTLFKAAASIPIGSLGYHGVIALACAISTLVILLAYFVHRKSVLPPFSFSLVAKFLFLAIFGSSCQFLGYRGIELHYPTVGSAVIVLLPNCIFALCIIYRMEKLVIRELSSKAKIMGTIMGTMISIIGAIVVVLYKVFRSTAPLVRDAPTSYDWILGGGIFAPSFFLPFIWFVIEVRIVNDYPIEFFLLLLYNLSSTIVSEPIFFILQPDLEAWKSNLALLPLLNVGIVGASIGIVVTLHIKGPVYVALFKLFSIAIAIVMGVIFLGDSLYLGSVVVALVISVGFCVVMWGKAQENVVEDMKICTEESPSSFSVSSK